MAYLCFHFSVEPPQPGSEILMALIADMGFESFDQTGTGFKAFIPEALRAGVDLAPLQFPDFRFSYTVEKIEERNWNEEWEKNFDPVEVDKLLRIRAPFHSGSPDHRIEIIITPKMSFGTGHHQTTRLMCRALFSCGVKNKRVLDMGCGTGVLAILAAKLGAAKVVAADIDPWSVENTKENCAVNAETIEILEGDIDVVENKEPFNIILANINKNILKRHLPGYAKLSAAGADIFLSGFFSHDAQQLSLLASDCGMQTVEQRAENEWCMLHLKML